MSPTVSIIVPTFNRLHYLRPAIESVLDQTFRDWELIIADDGSSGPTLAYLRELASLARVKVLPLAHCGRPSLVRNAALRAAVGEYVAFLDSDDVWMPAKLERQIGSLRARPERAWSYTGFQMVNASFEPLAKDIRFRPAVGWIVEDVLEHRTTIVQSSVALRRALLERTGLYDERLSLCSDLELWVRCALQGEADCVSEPLVSVRRHAEHGGDDVEACRDLCRALELIAPRLEPPLRSRLGRQRAIAAVTLARSQAVSGRRGAAVSTVLSSAAQGWIHRQWRRGAAAALGRALVPVSARRIRQSVPARLWRLLDPRERRALLALQGLSVAMAFSTVGGIAAIVPFFTVLADPGAVQRNAMLRTLSRVLPSGSGAAFTLALGLAFAGAVLLANAINLCGLLAINRFALRVGARLCVRLFEEYLHRDFAFHARASRAALATRILHDAARASSGILQQALLLVSNATTITFILATLMALDPAIAAAALIGLGASYAGIYAAVRRRLLRNGLLESRCYEQRSRAVDEGLAAVREITLAQARDAFVHRFAGECRTLSTATFSTFAIAQSPRPILECATVCCLVGVALYLHSRAPEASWIASLGFVGLAAYRLLPALHQIFSSLARMRADRPAFAAVCAELSGPRTVRPEPSPAAQREWRGRPRRELRLREVSFRHADGAAPAVAQVSLTIPAGALVGLAGPNGSGKTTLVDLLSGLLVPQAGRIEIDGIALDATNRSAWQSTIAYVPQSPVLLDATVAENVALGLAPEAIDRERLEAAVRVARFRECLDALPGGYGEMLGERGCRLSGGQRQRLALARALYRQSSLLILDEATSALDLAAEAAILEALRSLEPRRTIVLVAHRSSALGFCDVVYRLDRGSLVRSGRRESTVAAGGR